MYIFSLSLPSTAYQPDDADDDNNNNNAKAADDVNVWRAREVSNSAPREMMRVDRINRPLIEAALSLYKRPNLKLRPVPYIEFVGELGSDDGGPMKKFFSLTLRLY